MEDDDRLGIRRSDGPDSQGPEVVIVILTRDDRERTLRCLESIEGLEPIAAEVVLVDNGSRDGTLEAVAEGFPRVKRVRSESNLGVAGGRNLGAAHAGRLFPGAPLAFLDNDAWPEPGAYREMLRVLEAHPEVGLIAPKVYRPWSPVVIAAVGGHRINWYTGTIRSMGAGEEDGGQYDSHAPITCNGGACLVRRAVFEAMGGFDEGFNPYGWEDIDFALRARAAGFGIRLAPKAIFYHEGGKAGRGRSLPEYERAKTRGYFRLMRRHATRVQWLCCICLLPFRAAGGALSELLRGNWRVPFAQVSGALASRRAEADAGSENCDG